MKTSYVLAFMATCGLMGTLSAQPEPRQDMVVVDSDLADYDGDKCVLTGHVTVDHDLGHLSATQVVMVPAAGGNKGKPAHVQLNGDVVFSLKEGGRLQCAQADIDCRSLSGTFGGDARDAFVTYSEENDSRPLIVKGRRMGLAAMRDGDQHGDRAHKVHVSAITIDDDVSVHYGKDFVATGDRAVYRRESSAGLSGDNAQALSGTVTMQAGPTGNDCRVVTPRGDCIKAQAITIDTVRRQLTFTCPHGRLNGGGQPPEPVDFEADRLLWDEQAQALSLYGRVKLSQARLGELAAEEMQVTQRMADDGQKELAAVESAGKTVFSYVNEDKNLDHSLTCYGTTRIDHLKMEMWLFSPKDQQGVVAEDKQIHFDDIKGEVFADKAFVKYQLVNGAAVPTKIVLGGNVRILNTLMRHENGATTALQYALADQVEYVPQSSEMLFKANSGRRVLFYDKGNNLQVSAPALKIIRSTDGARKDTVQGYGDVRFSFIEREFEQLRQRFTFEKFNAALPTIK